MTDVPAYELPKVWKWERESGGQFASINRPVSGATHEAELPRGKHPLQLYSLATPNGVKVTVMLEELLAAGHSGAEYDAYVVDIGEGDQFGSGFVAINPNSKIPAMVDYSLPKPTRVFESGAILLYLAEKFGAFMPENPSDRAECLSWLFWQMGSAPYLGGGFGHLERLYLCPLQDGVSNRPLHHGGEAATGRAGQASGVAVRDALCGGRCVHHSRHGDLAVVWRAPTAARATTGGVSHAL